MSGSLIAQDPFGAAADTALPTLPRALEAERALRELGRLPRLAGRAPRLLSIQVVRHKPGRQCVVQYELELRGARGPERLALLGKIRAHRFGTSGHRLLSELWSKGFDEGSADGISVPEPIGVVTAFRMSVQRKVEGHPATELFAPPAGARPAVTPVALARRVAEAAHKVHRARVLAERAHGLADELKVLHLTLGVLALERPALAARIKSLLGACDRRGATLAAPVPTGIHRGFQPDQLLVDGDRLWLLDFDLYCEGDPALDTGSFLAHLTELALRRRGDATALRDAEDALAARFAELGGDAVRPSVRVYADLTLARHVYLSTRHPDRQRFTEPLLALCEERLR